MGAAATAELKLRLRRTLARVPREIIRARAQDALRVDKRHRLREITHPVLCLNGRSDRLVRKRHVDEIVALQPACEVRWLDAPHMLLAMHVEDSAAVIAGFCQRVELAGG